MASVNSNSERLPTKYGDDKLEQMPTHATYIDNESINSLTQEHRDYLMQRHGTLELDPVPDGHDADPYNWPRWKKITNILLVAFHAMMATFTAASIQSAFELISEDLGVSLQRTSYLTSLFIAIIGGAPLFWRPLSNRYGRRPIFLISLIGSAVCNIGCANCYSYATMGLCRALVAFFISPAAAIGTAVVQETFFKNERARWIGVWTLMVTIGVPISPFIFGFVVQRVDFRWIYWILAITNGVQLVLYTFFGPESRYLRKGVTHSSSVVKEAYFKFTRIDRTPLRFYDFIQPLTMGRHLCVLIPACAYAMVFIFVSILATVEIPQLFGPAFKFDAQQLGLQFVGVVIGSVIGEQLAGPLSDIWMRLCSKKHDGARPPAEHRLWLTYPGIALAICGYVVFLVQLDIIGDNYNITPVVGTAIGAAGNQIITTVLITYAVDCYSEEAASVGVFITFVRQTWGFLGPFYFTQMFDNLGLRGTAALGSGLMVGVALIPIAIIHFVGGRLHN